MTIDPSFLKDVVTNGMDKALGGDWDLCVRFVKVGGGATKLYPIGKGRLEVKPESVKLVADDSEIEFDEALGEIEALEVYSNSGVKILTVDKRMHVTRRVSVWWYGSVDGEGGGIVEFNGYWAE